jgi:hypothetical protein
MDEKVIIEKIKWWLQRNVKTKQGKDLVKDSRTLLKFIKMWENMDY